MFPSSGRRPLRVLTPATLLPLLLAAALNQPLNGAFGFDFGTPVPDTAIAATIATNEHPALPDNISLPELTDLSPTDSRWHYLIAEQLPDTIARSDPKVLALLTKDGYPARLIASVDESGCEGVYRWVTNSLARKYLVIAIVITHCRENRCVRRKGDRR